MTAILSNGFELKNSFACFFDFSNVSVNGLAALGSGISGSEEIINKWNEMLGSMTSLNSLG